MPPPVFPNWKAEERSDGILTVMFDRPSKKNAISSEGMYTQWKQYLLYAKSSELVKVLLFTGSGTFYSSGNDLAALTVDLSDAEAVRVFKDKIYFDLTSLFVEMIDFPKALVAWVNGPAIGVACTSLALFDFVYCHPSAYFKTPFMELAQSPEAGSSVTFPALMGRAAARMLMLSEPLSAAEAERVGLVTAVCADSKLAFETAGRLASTAPAALAAAKKLIRDPIRDALKKANQEEMSNLIKRMDDPEAQEAILRFVSRRAKL